MTPPVLNGPQRKELAAIRKFLKSYQPADLQQGYALAENGPTGTGPTEAVFAAMIGDNFAWVNRAVRGVNRGQVRDWLTQTAIAHFASFDAEFKVDGGEVVGGQLSRGGLPVAGAEALRVLAKLRRGPDMEARLGGLTDLDLSGAGAVRPGLLAGLGGLRRLNLSGAPMEDLSGLPALPALTELCLARCHALKDLGGLRAFPALESLDLSECQNLTGLDALSRLPALRAVSLCRLHRLPPMEALLKLPAGLALDLTGCSGITPLNQLLLDARVVQSGSGADARLGVDQVAAAGGRLVRGATDQTECAGRQAFLGLVRARREGWLAEIREVNLSGLKGLTNLDVLEGMTWLRRLDLRGCEAIQEAGVIAAMSELTEFYGSGRMPLPPALLARRRAANALLSPGLARETYRAGAGQGGADGVEFALVCCPAGTYRVGDTRSAHPAPDEPPREVTTGRLAVAEFPVTQALYAAVIGKSPSFFSGDSSLPVEQVNWYDAVRFCNALSAMAGLAPAYRIGGEDAPGDVRCDPAGGGFRLPTAAEREVAARAGQDTIYAGSDTPDEVGWYWRNAGDRTQPVGRLVPNAWGLYDMGGNVWEWAEDADGAGRVYCGGSWMYHPRFMRVSARNHADPGARYPTLGFRVVRSIA